MTGEKKFDVMQELEKVEKSSLHKVEKIERALRRATSEIFQHHVKKEEDELIMSKRILLFVPNIICYIRLILIVSAFLFAEKPIWLLTLYSISAILDWLDGYAARRLHQVSAFGALLDVLVDNIGRGMLWCQMFSWGYFVSVIEWIALVTTHFKGANWKTSGGPYPWLVEKVMQKGFKTLAGIYAISGLHVLPIWLYAYKTGIFSQIHIPNLIQLFGIGLLAVGRLLCFRVEVFFIASHICLLCSEHHA